MFIMQEMASALIAGVVEITCLEFEDANGLH
jgi:hypothetical protein